MYVHISFIGDIYCLNCIENAWQVIEIYEYDCSFCMIHSWWLIFLLIPIFQTVPRRVYQFGSGSYLIFKLYAYCIVMHTVYIKAYQKKCIKIGWLAVVDTGSSCWCGMNMKSNTQMSQLYLQLHCYQYTIALGLNASSLELNIGVEWSYTHRTQLVLVILCDQIGDVYSILYKKVYK